ncbi:hypothetical protein NQ315_014453 [Exocentrus adspersus]|nr:hypothetical protein NQ315_014453 [Exocentrus adspersus]
MLISNQLASSFSWYGRKKKNVFKDTLLAKLIIAAAEKAIKTNTNRDTEVAIQTWLRRAEERRQSQLRKENRLNG